tara:strand:- start:36 stop:1283 length:1248 start_codon:yes stop_codon:yes gene_type:complete
MLRLNEEHQRSGNGLGYQMTAYAMMRTICDKKGLEYSANLHALRNTFSGINIESIDIPGMQGDQSAEFMIDDSFDSVYDKSDDNVTLYGYPTPMILNTMDSSDFNKVKKHFEFRKEIYDRCLKWKNDNFGDRELISMHVRRGDFADDKSGMFLIGNDYYEKALELLPKDLPVLIFCNDESYILEEPKWNVNGNSRFILIPDMITGKGSDKTDWHHLNQVLSDESIGLDLDLSPEINSLYLNHLVDYQGDNEFLYSNAIQELKSYGYESPPQCGQKCFETRKDCYRDKPDREFTKECQYKIEHDLYDYSFDLCLMSMCNYHIAANSLYGLWGIELSNSKKVIYPKYWSQGMNNDPDAVVCENPESCRPGFRCNQDMSIVKDLGGFNQTAAFLGSWIKDNWIGLENPDQRGEKWGCC